uniref:Uncharacterized protein n=1 Tax=Cannabis sativa TaxID=3483 RepID=A0A803PB11_CANSA
MEAPLSVKVSIHPSRPFDDQRVQMASGSHPGSRSVSSPSFSLSLHVWDPHAGAGLPPPPASSAFPANQPAPHAISSASPPIPARQLPPAEEKE